MKIKTKSNKWHFINLIFIGILAYIFADVIHEVLGHGLSCIISGGKITLISSVYFRSQNHSFVTDSFGPLANVICGFLIWCFLKKSDFKNFHVKLLLIITMAFNFFWFSWQFLYASVINKGDFAFNIGSQNGQIIWRIFIFIIGLFAYLVFFKLIGTTVKKRLNYNLFKIKDLNRLFSIPYLSAGISAIIIVLFYQPQTFETLLEAFVFPMFYPVILIPKYLRVEKDSENKKLTPAKNKLIIPIFGLIIFVLFCFTMGRGLRF